MTNKILIYAIVNIISIIILTLIPYLFISYVNWEWQNIGKWKGEFRVMFAHAQGLIYLSLILINIELAFYFDKLERLKKHDK